MKDENGLTYLDHDEHMRPEADIQTLGALMPSFKMMGEFTGFGDLAIQRFPELERIEHRHRAGNSSGIVGGASAPTSRPRS